jgi:hypothetical protein
LSRIRSRPMSREPTDSLLLDDTDDTALQLKPTSRHLPSHEQEWNGDGCTTEYEGTPVSGSFEDLAIPDTFLGNMDSFKRLWIFPLAGPRPRLDGVKNYDLICERDPLLLTYGLSSQALWVMEERLFNDPELNDSQKAMYSLWTRWLALYRCGTCWFLASKRFLIDILQS